MPGSNMNLSNKRMAAKINTQCKQTNTPCVCVPVLYFWGILYPTNALLDLCSLSVVSRSLFFTQKQTQLQDFTAETSPTSSNTPRISMNSIP